jgi:hypothetical protein
VPQRTIGRLRRQGTSRSAILNLALNSGLPLVDPTGGFYYVFLTGEPMFRKYDAAGKLVFERHIEGREIDDLVATQPDDVADETGGRSRGPFRSADRPHRRRRSARSAVDIAASFRTPTSTTRTATKRGTAQFSARAVISPTSLFFTRGGHILVTPGCYEFDPNRR